MLSKTLPFGDPKKFVMRNEEWLKEADIDVVYDTVYSIHTDSK
jgi:hypothetical protein